ncbi:phosphoethanolamine transferase [Elongatibacter sediminis]|uniref:Phosphoethanolamine--lipid A transferase n=1 Tax=Elongatibacter sediminis TaxID=3119006 RepID=A0AAW9RDF8_9GAMM
MKVCWSTNRLVLAAAVFLAAFANLTFFRNVAIVLADDPQRILHAVSLTLILLCALILLIAAFSFRRVIRPFLMVLFVVSAGAAYFMDTFNVIIDSDMILNALSTDAAEVGDLLTGRLAAYLLLLGVLPAVLVWRVEIRPMPLLKALKTRLALVGGALAVLTLAAFVSSSFMATFVREHKAVRYYANPLTPVYSAYRFASSRAVRADQPLEKIGEDARIPAADVHRELVILVVGETARADRFSLNGYPRETNPELASRDVISFDNVSACGTSTAVSVPCMFAVSGRADFDGRRAQSTENLLDVLQHANVNLLWRDNNSSSKGVAERIRAEDFRTVEANPVCDLECRDEGMLAGLQSLVDRQPSGDILIVLHQMGSHGPAYYKRYPESYRVFRPTCESEQLDSCTEEQISNSYDNTIRYTDHFLARVVDFLHSNDARFETAMVYISDHGESLGEGGIYLHGMPYWMAPESQVAVPMIMWFGSNYDEVDVSALKRLIHAPLSHDNLFHTMLGIFEVSAEVYDEKKDLLYQSRVLQGQSAEYDG